jgi:hypothetical protein
VAGILAAMTREDKGRKPRVRIRTRSDEQPRHYLGNGTDIDGVEWLPIRSDVDGGRVKRGMVDLTVDEG